MLDVDDPENIVEERLLMLKKISNWIFLSNSLKILICLFQQMQRVTQYPHFMTSHYMLMKPIKFVTWLLKSQGGLIIKWRWENLFSCFCWISRNENWLLTSPVSMKWLPLWCLNYPAIKPCKMVCGSASELDEKIHWARRQFILFWNKLPKVKLKSCICQSISVKEMFIGHVEYQIENTNTWVLKLNRF